MTRIALATLIAALFLHSVSPAADAVRKPNVIVILADDLGYADVGYHGCRDIPTPHIDSIARTGVRCTHGYTSGAVCSPTRAGLLTGRYQQRFGHESNGFGPEGGLPLTEVTIAERMKAAGYVTGIVGKWHLGTGPDYHPLKRGFDELYGFLGGQHDYFRPLPRSNNPILRNHEPVEFKGYLTDVLSHEAAAFVERHQGKPFFLYLSYNAPHTPLQAPPERLEKFKSIADPRRRPYAAMVSAMDDGIGVVLDKVRALDLDKDTLIFFLSDNGGALGINGASNEPLGGGKGTIREGGIRVPFLVRWPGRLPAGKTYDEPVISLDIFSTALAAAGGAPPEKVKIDGVDLLPYLSGQKQGSPHEMLFWRLNGGETGAVRQGRYKLVKTGTRPPRLQDLLGKGEQGDVRQPEQLDRMLRAYEAWNAELMAPLWGPGSSKP